MLTFKIMESLKLKIIPTLLRKENVITAPFPKLTWKWLVSRESFAVKLLLCKRLVIYTSFSFFYHRVFINNTNVKIVLNSMHLRNQGKILFTYLNLQLKTTTFILYYMEEKRAQFSVVHSRWCHNSLRNTEFCHLVPLLFT